MGAWRCSPRTRGIKSDGWPYYPPVCVRKRSVDAACGMNVSCICESNRRLRLRNGKVMRKQGSTGSWVVAVVVVLAVIAAGMFLAHKGTHTERSTSPLPLPAVPATTGSATTPIQHPIAQAQAAPASASTVALPALGESDAGVTAALERLSGNSGLSSLLVRPQLIARIVDRNAGTK